MEQIDAVIGVALDTNVIVSAVLTAHGGWTQILDMLSDGVFGDYVDDRIPAEYDSVLRRAQFHLIPDDVAEVMGMVHSIAEPAVAVPLLVERPHAGDMPSLEVAASAGALLVTGNTRHYPKPLGLGVIDLTPREFMEVLRHSP